MVARREPLREDEGYDIYVNGVQRTFRDTESIAFEAARNLRYFSEYKDKVEVVVRATGRRIEVDGR